MAFDAHGKYDLSVRGEIIIVRAFQSWNLEGMKAFSKAYKAFVLDQKFKQFGVLGDLRKMEGATPETVEPFQQLSEWTLANGQIARAQIIDSALKEFLINESSKGKDLFPIQSFVDEAPALVWLERLGLAIH